MTTQSDEMRSNTGPNAPSGLNERSRRLWREIIRDYGDGMGGHQLELLRKALDLLTITDGLRETLRQHRTMPTESELHIAQTFGDEYVPGTFCFRCSGPANAPACTIYLDRFGQPKERPEVAQMLRSTDLMLKIFEKLYLDPPEDEDD